MPIRWYFDFISPFSYLHWQKVKALPEAVTPVPIVFGAVLAACGQKGPAEIPGKREFTYRHVLWQARQEGVALRFPPVHPFNPLAALRLCVAAGASAEAVDAIFDWIWKDGHPGDSFEALAPVAAALGIDAAATQGEDTKARLRANTEAAIAAGVYGVPTLAFAEHLFWGNDAHAFALAALRNPALLADPEMQRVGALPVGVQRR
ncbi:2-hydroxychromene-2-carboxylate isomerase [Lysobacter solisilvae (ex Woo and Kim 2020)]|uniref:2-hydroxychromene-2-carboxylate isomerase n=1 Tax=Agrilutibacter terrestris TaxID=2865112 RepID=A0A7H0G0F6_9GAMM|nr:DsbA family protein [Lysobacter terrestris]QNP41772.1 DsbA family protein [Lysobacter terrestris]